MPPKILLIGQGVAGTLLAWSLQKRGAEVHIADANLAGSSTSPAAGIINPVTGKRFVKSEQFETWYTCACTTYGELEVELNQTFWENRPILRLLGTAEEANDWSIRCAQAEYSEHLAEIPDAGAWSPLLKTGFTFGLIQQAARVQLKELTMAFRQKMTQKGYFSPEKIEYSDVQTLLKTYDQIVFCEGWQAMENPYFPESGFRVSKGEALLLQFAEPPDATLPVPMLKKTMLLTPLADNLFWAGSTYRWHFDDTLPSADGRAYMESYLREMFAVPFEVVDQVAGIRPTMIQRNPIVAQSTVNSHVFMLNGLGTKGALLAPYFAEQMADKMSCL